VGRLDGNMGIRTVLGQNHFLRSFCAAHLDRLVDGTSDEAFRFLRVQTGLRTGFQMRLSGKE
jgi:hypothetical protein